MTKQLPELSDLEWLVRRRNDIQRLMLGLYERRPGTEHALPSATFQLATGAAFSLWRAVFLLVGDNTARKLEAPDAHATEFLAKVIETNTIGFTDDRNASVWSSGYYINNASFRVGRLMKHEMPLNLERQLPKNAWDSCYTLLADGLENGFPIDSSD